MLTGIHKTLEGLSKAERAVAEWVLKHPRQATGATVADVAAAAGVSEPTVIRFCRSVGLTGFRQLKLRLAETLSQPGSFVHKDVDANDSVDDAVTKVLDRSIQALHELRTRVTALPFGAAIDELARARQIVFAGLGASGEVARDAHQKFFRLGIPCAIATDTPMFLQVAAIAERGDVFIVISHTGRWPALGRGADEARSNGARVIALTAPASPLAAAATHVFGSQVAEDTSVFTPMSSRLAQLAVLDALQVSLAVRLGPAAERRLRATKKALVSA